jgi:hypothetical protein
MACSVAVCLFAVELVWKAGSVVAGFMAGAGSSSGSADGSMASRKDGRRSRIRTQRSWQSADMLVVRAMRWVIYCCVMFSGVWGLAGCG